jgi:hypothetical protein
VAAVKLTLPAQQRQQQEEGRARSGPGRRLAWQQWQLLLLLPPVCSQAVSQGMGMTALRMLQLHWRFTMCTASLW